MELQGSSYRPALFIGALFVLPLVTPPVLFAWLDAFYATLVCCVLVLLGWQAGLRQLGYGLGAAAVAALFLQQLELFLFSLSACPLGMVLAKGAVQREPVARSGAKGLLALALSWLFFWMIFAQLTQSNPYREMLEALDKGLTETLVLYNSEENGLSVETRQQVQSIIDALRAALPQLLPAIWLGMATMTVWMNLVLSNSLLGRLRTGGYPWGLYRHWRLPDQLVWLPIAAALILMLRIGPLQSLSLWVLVVTTLLYGFQGLAVCLYFFERWRFPAFVRILAIFFLLIQGYGLMLLALLGLSDVWLDWRRRPKRPGDIDRENRE